MVRLVAMVASGRRVPVARPARGANIKYHLSLSDSDRLRLLLKIRFGDVKEASRQDKQGSKPDKKERPAR